jgi:hypothetical protein
MRIVKGILLVILIIIAIPLIIALFIRKEYTVQREIVIHKPKQEVFAYITHLKNQDNYNKWVMRDPKMKKEFKGTDGTVGFVYAWNSDSDAGEGEQEIKQIKEREMVDVEVRFVRPFESVAKTPMMTEAVSENETKVKWEMQGRSPYPLNFMNLFMDKMLGKDLEVSLSSLKNILEK